MLEKITGTFSSIIKTLSGKSSITEKNIENEYSIKPLALTKYGVTG